MLPTTLTNVYMFLMLFGAQLLLFGLVEWISRSLSSRRHKDSLVVMKQETTFGELTSSQVEKQ